MRNDTICVALDELLPFLQSISVRKGQRFFLEGREIHFSGFMVPSGGGVQIACFSHKRPKRPKKKTRRPCKEPPKLYRGAVLMRPQTDDERKTEEIPEDYAGRVVLEVLTSPDPTADRTILERTAHTASYPTLV